MIVANAIIRGDKNRLLSFKKINNPVTLQIGGSIPMNWLKHVKSLKIMVIKKLT